MMSSRGRRRRNEESNSYHLDSDSEDILNDRHRTSEDSDLHRKSSSSSNPFE